MADRPLGMLRSIVIGLDAVTPDGAALFSACDLAGDFHAKLRVVICPDRSDIAGGEAHGIGSGQMAVHRDTVLTERLNERLQRERFELVRRLGQSGIPLEILEYAGKPLEVMAAESQRSDLVVLPHGRPETKARDDFDVGFALPVDAILQRIVRPALLVGQTTIGPGPVVIAYDGSPSAQRALHSGLLLGLFGARDAVVLSVGYSQDAAREMAAPAAALVAGHGHAVTIEAVAAQGEAAEQILRIVPEMAPGLFVSGCFGGQGLLEWLLGGTTEHLLPAIEAPWLVQH